MDSMSSNFDSLATSGDASQLCLYEGCLSPTATNYDSLATAHDFSCRYSITGCTDSGKVNYSPLATEDDGSCSEDLRFGCSHELAVNYDPLATSDDGSCEFAVSGCTDSTATNFYSDAGADDGSCVATVTGCMSPIAVNYNSNATVDDDSCVYGVSGCMDSTASNYLSQATVAGGTACAYPIEGCMVPRAENYDSLANTDDGSCTFLVLGCMDSTSLNYNPNAEADSGCIDLVSGCMVPSATNYDSTASLDDASCKFAVNGCTDSLAINFLDSATADDGSCQILREGCMLPSALNYNSLATRHVNDLCVFERLGCTDSSATNYNSIANTDDSSCYVAIVGCTDELANNFNADATVANSSACEYSVLGCTDSNALTFNPIATEDDGTCEAFEEGCTVVSAANYDSRANTYDGSCVFTVSGCTDSTALNFRTYAETDDGSCIPRLYGCMDLIATNYDSDATITDNSCDYPISGCTDSRAANYNPNAVGDDSGCRLTGCTDTVANNYVPYANVNDGSCDYPVTGCTDQTAPNYYPLATVEDGSCVYLGCLDSTAANFDLSATDNDGSCIAYVVGCADSRASNYLVSVTLHDQSTCRYPGCTFSAAKNFDPTANYYDGTCVAYVYGCTDSRAINYDIGGVVAEIDDGSCAIPGCTGSMATNYYSEANVDDASCIYNRAEGRGASFGYLGECEVFVDSNGDLILDDSEAFSSTSRTGYYSVPYLFKGTVQMQSTERYGCIDTITGNSLISPLRSTVDAGISSQLTTVAMAIIGGGARLTFGMKQTVAASVADSYSAVDASAIVCSNLVPCVSCETSGSLQPCDDITQCVDACNLDGSPLSVFDFDALRLFLLGDFPDNAWAAWLIGQINTENSVKVALYSLQCGSAELCGTLCNLCGEVGNYTSVELGEEIYATLASMTLEGPVGLEESSGAAIQTLIERTAERLSIEASSVAELAAQAGASNLLTYSVLLGFSSGRRRLHLGMGSNSQRSFAGPSDASLRVIRELLASVRSASTVSSSQFSSTRSRVDTAPQDLIVGCTDERAVNYDAQAQISDESCLILGCTSSEAMNYDGTSTRDDGSCVAPHRGCTIRTAMNFDPSANTYDHSCRFHSAACSDPLAANYLALTQCQYTGCTSSVALNFNRDATLDDGSCKHPRRGCTWSSAANFQSFASVDDGSCVKLGCTSTNAGNFDPDANLADSSCIFSTPRGCTHPTAVNYDPRARYNDGSCIHLGCTDPRRPKYSPAANVDDGSCGVLLAGCRNPRADNFVPNATADAPCALRGCTAVDALNFDADATVDDNSCVQRHRGCVDSSALNYLPSATDDDGSCYIPGCTDSLAVNFASTATVHDGSCRVRVGCMDALFADNFDPRARVPNHSCVYLGCTDPTAINFDRNATVDDGRCEWLPAGLATLVWPDLRSYSSEIGAAPLLFADGAVRRVSLGSSRYRIGGLPLGMAKSQPNGAGAMLLAVGVEKEEIKGLASAGAVYLLTMQSAGSLAVVRRIPEISDDEQDDIGATSVYSPLPAEQDALLLSAFDHFGCAVQPLTDLDGDGISELAIGAKGDDDGATDAGAVYVLFLDMHGRIRRYVKITRAQSGGLFGSSLGTSARLAPSSSTLPDLIVGAPGQDNHRGAVHLLYLQADGSVRDSVELSASTWPQPIPPHALLGSSVAIKQSYTGYGYWLAVGAPGMQGSEGAVFILHMAGRELLGHTLVKPPDHLVLEHLGTSLAFAAALKAESTTTLLIGSSSMIYTLLMPERNQTSTSWRWFTAFEHEQLASAGPYGGARQVAVVHTRTHGSKGGAPLYWLSRFDASLGLLNNSTSPKAPIRPISAPRVRRPRQEPRTSTPCTRPLWAFGLAAALGTAWCLSTLVRCRATASSIAG